MRAEVAFHKGKHRSISESEIAVAINDLARAMKAPGYAFTSVEQIRALQAGMLPLLPNFLGGRLAEDITVNQGFSPLEAGYLTILMLRQKMTNPYFQVTQLEWEQRDKAKKSAPPRSRQETEEEVAQSYSKNPKRAEMERTISERATGGAAETIEIAQRMLDLMGIERQGPTIKKKNIYSAPYCRPGAAALGVDMYRWGWTTSSFFNVKVESWRL